MREIKFRAWLQGRMIYITTDDDYFIDGDGRLVKIEQNENGCKYQGFEDCECNLMQYTGLKDKDGREIYEGDIVQFTVFDCFDNDKQFKGVVKFAEGQWQIWNSTESEYYGSDGAFDLWYVNQQDDEFEIVGNIYENPELLEESQNGTK